MTDVITRFMIRRRNPRNPENPRKTVAIPISTVLKSTTRQPVNTKVAG
jgi:hypothetical protein